VTNPKALIPFGAVLLQFVNRVAGYVPVQMLPLSLVSIGIGPMSDSTWGVTAGQLRTWFGRSPRRFAIVGGAGGLAMIGVGDRCCDRAARRPPKRWRNHGCGRACVSRPRADRLHARRHANFARKMRGHWSMDNGQSLTAQAYQRLRSEIIQGRIRPNVHLVAADLAERLETSRTPIREALQLLASEGLVVAAKRGYMVREHTRDEIREIYEVRAALEEMAARLAAQRADDEQIHAIEAIGAHSRSLARDLRSDIQDARTLVVMLNDEFHDAIMRASGNARLADINQRNSEHFFSHEIGKLYSSEEAGRAVTGHARIIAALKRRDPGAAGAAAREHVLEALEVTLSKLR
jgi:DNA-binding GntR family transcriptional regulator